MVGSTGLSFPRSLSVETLERANCSGKRLAHNKVDTHTQTHACDLMVPSEEVTPVHPTMEETHKDVDATAGVATGHSTNSNNYWTEEDSASAAATAKSLAERMQRTFPFAQSPLPRPPTLSRPGSFRLDAIMNAEEPASASAAMDMDDSAHSSYLYGNENSSQNSNDAHPQEQHQESGKSSLAFILGNDKQSNQQQRDTGRYHHVREVEEDEEEDDDDEDNDWGDASSDASFGTSTTRNPSAILYNCLPNAERVSLFCSCVMCRPPRRTRGAQQHQRAQRPVVVREIITRSRQVSCKTRGGRVFEPQPDQEVAHLQVRRLHALRRQPRALHRPRGTFVCPVACCAWWPRWSLVLMLRNSKHGHCNVLKWIFLSTLQFFSTVLSTIARTVLQKTEACQAFMSRISPHVCLFALVMCWFVCTHPWLCFANLFACLCAQGGKRCAIVGCTSSAKNLGVCWKHGASDYTYVKALTRRPHPHPLHLSVSLLQAARPSARSTAATTAPSRAASAGPTAAARTAAETAAPRPRSPTGSAGRTAVVCARMYTFACV